jgi:ABC-type transporter Mla maintaining outer membrane lipid asymmetry ATPase subunit MlaF/ABC-type transporter Mla maintaining outer membrane lipid asymmetry permease subunit MlaE
VSKHVENLPAASPQHHVGTRVELRELCVSAGRRPLLAKTSATFQAGQVTLIVGGSGVGKSVLLKLLAGLIDGSHSAFDVSGEIRFNENDILQNPRRGSVGIVFQSFALFDEFSSVENVQLASDHRAGSADESQTAKALLSELNVPSGIRLSALSGGQRQRVAIARTLAFASDVVLYDEPTSGLDAASAVQVAKLIRNTHDSHPRTSIIVTHDYDALPQIADAVFVLDAEHKTLREVNRDEWPQLRRLLAETSHVSVDHDAPPTSVTRRALAMVGGFFETTTNAAAAVATGPLRLLPVWKSPRWGMRYLLHYLRLVAGPTAWVYIALSGLIVGFVTTYFTFKFLPYADYTEPLLIEDLLHSTGFALFRILVPVLATILIAARSGAAVASDIGGKAYGGQMDALRTLGARPDRYLLTGVLYAFLLGTPVLVGIGYAVAAVTSLLVFAVTHPEQGAMFWDLHFHRELRIPGSWLYAGLGWLVSKTLLCAGGIALISYYRGARPKHSTRDVSLGITSAILWSTLYVLVVNFAYSFIEFE